MTEATVLKFEEAVGALPTLTLTDEYGESETLDVSPHVWARLEQYCAYRWTSRQCVWTVQGPGDFLPHLAPVSNYVIDQWDDTQKIWETAITEQTALGFYLPRSCVYRVTATVGDTADPAPQQVSEAYRRLAAYMQEAKADTVPVGAASHSLNLAGGLDESIERNPELYRQSDAIQWGR